MSLRSQVEREIARMADLPVVSRILVHLNRVAEDERTSAQDLSQVILRDQALTVRILRAVNSSYYRRRGQPAVTTISAAVVILGFNGVRRLALGMAMFDQLRERGQHALGRRLGGHSLLTAVAARFLAARSGYDPAEEAFVAGLINDMGRLVLLSCDGEGYAGLLADDPAPEVLRRRERRRYGLTSGQAGRLLARRWDLPPTLYDLLGDPQDRGEKAAASPLGTLVGAAREVARVLASDPSGKALEHLLAADETVAGVPSGLLAGLLDAVAGDYADLAQDLGVDDALAAPPPEWPAYGRSAGDGVDRVLVLDRLGDVQAALLARRPDTAPAALALDALHAALGIPRVLLWVVDPGGRRLVATGGRGWREDPAAALEPIPLSERAGLVARCALERRELRMPDLDAPDLPPSDRERLLTLRSGPVALLPLVDRDVPLGVVWLDAGRSVASPSPEVIATARLFAQLLTLALVRP
ncbi:MAG: HDOD domain-containing protein [Candidatus Krumholzibacteriia bacterium]